MKPKILICDDEMGICVFLSLSLEDNYDVSIANKGKKYSVSTFGFNVR